MTKPGWRWYVFGGKGSKNVLMLVETPYDVPLWRRILTRILLGSQWERISIKLEQE